MKIAFVFGTRPEIIKLSSLIRECVRKKIPFISIHTGQHYSYNMSRLFLKELDLPVPDYNLMVTSQAPYMQADHTGRMMAALEKILLKEMPSVVLVQGDTNSALAGALTASKISTTRAFTGFNIKVGHVEAGLRSYDRTMPEEINRVIADHLSDYLFAPTRETAKIAAREGVAKKKIHVTGNTVVDALYYGVKRTAREKGEILSRFGVKKGEYMLLTLHRQENVDNKGRFLGILSALKKIHGRYKMPVIFPAHPRTVKKIKNFGMNVEDFLKVIEPCGFVEFLQLEANAALILTDSGGVQEEACVLKVPSVTLRDSTERPETVKAGANIVAGVKPAGIIKAADKMMKKKRNWKNPLGDGRSAVRILNILRKANR